MDCIMVLARITKGFSSFGFPPSDPMMLKGAGKV